MHIPQRDIDTSEEAKLFMANLQKVLADATSPKKLIREALIPAFGIRWDAQVIRSVEGGRLRRITRSLRNSKLDALTYRMVSHLLKSDSETGTDFPEAWTEWRATIERFNFDDEFKLSEWIDVIGAFSKLGWDSPSKLALATPTQLRLAMEVYRNSTAALQLWTSAALLSAGLSSASFLILNGGSGNAEKFPHRINSDTFRNNAARSDVKMALGRSKIHKLPKDFDKMGHSPKLQTLRKDQSPIQNEQVLSHRLAIHRFNRNSAALPHHRFRNSMILQLSRAS